MSAVALKLLISSFALHLKIKPWYLSSRTEHISFAAQYLVRHVWGFFFQKESRGLSEDFKYRTGPAQYKLSDPYFVTD